MHLSPQGSSVHGFLQARILEWVFFFFTTSATWEAQDIKKLSKYLGWLRSRPSAELLVMPPVYNQVPKGAPSIQPGP